MQSHSASHPNERPIPSTYAPARDDMVRRMKRGEAYSGALPWGMSHALRRNTDGAPGFSRVEAGAGVATSIAAGNGGEAAVRASVRVCHVSPDPQNGGVAR